jgi:type I restriction enzyme, S subunit
MVSLGDVLTIEQDEVLIEPNETYRTAGIYSFGRGGFERQLILGADTSYTSLFRLHENQFILSRLNGWEGAVDVVPAELDGCLVSSEYPTFAIDTDLAYPGYLRWLSRWSRFWEQLIPRGSMVRRKRVKPGQLLEVEIPLPPLTEQLAAVTYLESIHNWQRSISKHLNRNAADALVATLPTFVDTLTADAATGHERVSELVDFVSDTIHPGENPSPANTFVGLQHIESHTGRCLGSDTLESLEGRKFRFRPGDVIYGYLRPYQNKVWLADRHGLCSVDQYVLRPRPSVEPALLAHTLRGRRVLDSTIELTHSLQLPRLRSGLLSSIEVPIVTGRAAIKLSEQLNLLRDRVVAVAAKRQSQIKLSRALIPAALNEVFGSR